MERMVIQKEEERKEKNISRKTSKKSTSKLTPRSKQAIKLEIDRIKELGLSGEDTFLLACSLINTVYYLNQKVVVKYSKHKNQGDNDGNL